MHPVESHWEWAGTTGVDSGTIIVTDPCYVIGDNGSEYEPVQNYDQFSAYLHSHEHDGRAQLVNQHGADLGVVVTRFGGDGLFDVFVQKDRQGTVLAAMIRFDGEKPEGMDDGSGV
jgi:hypothetical protein